MTRRSGQRGLVLAWLLLVAGLSGCGVGAEERARALDPNAAPYRVVTRERTVPPAGSHRVAVFLVRDGALVPVPRWIPEPPGPANVLAILSAGPSEQEQSEGLSSVLPLDRDARVVAVAGSIVTVALPAASDTSTRSDAVLGFGQLVLTLTAVPTISGVLFEQDGKPLQVPRADGSLTTVPLARVDYRDLIDPA